MVKLSCLLLLAVLIWQEQWQPLLAQTSDKPQYYSIPDTIHGVFFDIENLNFISNNEYNSNVMPGYTLLGTWISTTLRYRVNDKLSLETGAHLKRFFGADSTSNHSPFLLRAIFNPIPSITITLGELNHRYYWEMPRQMLDLENLFLYPREEGLSFSYFGNSMIEGEAWINWQRYIYSGSPFREEFTAGFNSRITLLDKNDLSVHLPLHYISKHIGGEIDSEPKLAETVGNKAVGLSINKKLKGSLFKSMALDMTFFDYNRSNHSTLSPYSKGFGIYPKLSTQFLKSRLSIAYWYSENYASYWGDMIYSNYMDGVSYKKREMLDLNYQWNYQWSDDLFFSFRTMAYYDLSKKQIDLRAGIILYINKSFKLTSLPD